jgi:hypothetical protein
MKIHCIDKDCSCTFEFFKLILENYNLKRNSLELDVINSVGNIVGNIKYYSLIKKDVKRLPQPKKFKIIKINEYEYHYCKIFNGETTIYFKKNLTFIKPEFIYNYKQSEKKENKLTINYFCIVDEKIRNDVKTKIFFNNFSKNLQLKLSNVNNTIILKKNDEYSLDVESFMDIVSNRYNISVYKNEGRKFPVLSLKVHFDSDLNIIKPCKDYFKRISISYFYLSDKLIASSNVNKNIENKIQKIFIDILNDNREILFIKNKKIDKNCVKISLRSLL